MKCVNKVLEGNEIENDTLRMKVKVSLCRFYRRFVPYFFLLLIASSLVLSTLLEYSSHLIFIALLCYENNILSEGKNWKS